MIAAEVRRGSQVHHVFQIGRAQIAPLTMLKPLSTSPISIAARPSASWRGLRRTRYITPATTPMKKASAPPMNAPRCR